MQRRNEDNLVPLGQLVLELAFELPVGRVDEDEDSWSTDDDVQAERSAPPPHLPRPQGNLRMARHETYMVSPCENNSGRFLSSSKYSLNHQIRKRMSVCLPCSGAGAVGGAGEVEEVGAMDGGS